MALFNKLTPLPHRHIIIASGFIIIFLLLLAARFPTQGSLLPSLQASTSPSRLTDARERSLQTIQNATLGFERILAINLPERTDRRDGLALAAAVSNVHVEFVPGVHGDTVIDKALPPSHAESIASAQRGSWRAHMNAIRRVVENNWTTALILEDDVDWDVRLKSILSNVAVASNAVLSHPGSDQLTFNQVTASYLPQVSPYGDGWDLLWLGHCGMEIPEKSTIVLFEDDDTVPEARYLRSWDIEAISPLATYPPHSRVVFEQREGVCSLAYAVSQSGARELLSSLGLTRFDHPLDLMLRQWCQGVTGDVPHRCISVLPQIFDHHRPAGSWAGDSDISVSEEGNRDKPATLNIRWSVRMNMRKILRGQTDYDDQYPDS